MTPLGQVLQALRSTNCRPTLSGGIWESTCPAHDDVSASLCISEDSDERVVLGCQEGCEPSDVLRVLGLTWAELHDDGPQPQREVTRRPRLMFQKAGQVGPTKPDWLWRNWLEARSLHLLIGRQGGGKSTVATWVIATLTRGAAWLDDPTSREPIRCAMLSLEEPAERLTARLLAVGADLDQVLIIGDVEDLDREGKSYPRPWRLPKDCGVLEELLNSEHVGLVVIDGLGYSVGGDSHNYANVGSSLSALAGVAERTGTAILGLTHPPKGASDPVTAAIGSTAWTAIPRITWVLGVDPEDEKRCVVRVGKTNYAEPPSGLAFTIDSDDKYEVGYVSNLMASSVAAEDLTAAAPAPGDRTEREEARELVRSLLASGPMDTADVMKQTRAAGLSDTTVKRARRDLRVTAESRKDATTGRHVGWLMRLPDQETRTADFPEVQPPLEPVDPLDLTRTFEPSGGPDGQGPENAPLDDLDLRLRDLADDSDLDLRLRDLADDSDLDLRLRDLADDSDLDLRLRDLADTGINSDGSCPLCGTGPVRRSTFGWLACRHQIEKGLVPDV